MFKPPLAGALTAYFVAGSILGVAQSQQTLNVLTVPAATLPSGCALSQPTPVPSMRRGGATVIAGWSSFPTNPWSGHDRKIVTAVRKAIDGSPRLPDGPPFNAHDAQAFELKLADHVVDAYHAAYGSATDLKMEVFAMTFDDISLATQGPLPATMNPRDGFRDRLVKGPTVVVVSATVANECVRAIDVYIRSIK